MASLSRTDRVWRTVIYRHSSLVYWPEDHTLQCTVSAVLGPNLGYPKTVLTLQACASISVSKLCNFHLPYLVNFVKNLYSVFSPKYLGLPVLTKYFVPKKLFVSWGRPSFLLFYLNFGPLLHLQYMKFTKKAFLQSCRYGKYCSFATLVTPITVLGA